MGARVPPTGLPHRPEDRGMIHLRNVLFGVVCAVIILHLWAWLFG